MGSTPTGPAILDKSIFTRKDPDFWAGDDGQSDPVSNALLGSFSGVVVDAPKRIPIGERRTFPIRTYHIGPNAEVMLSPFDRFGIITLMDVLENRLYVTHPGMMGDTDVINEPQADPDEIPEGSLSSSQDLDIREALGLPWRPARYLLTTILRGQVSNRVAVELISKGGAFQDDEVAKYEASLRAKANPPVIAPQPADPLPSFEKLPESPELPEEPGIVLNATRIVDLKRNPKSILYGAFKLPVLPQEVVKPDEFKDPYYEANPDKPKPAAVVGIILLLAGADDASGHLSSIHIPITGPLPEPAEAGKAPLISGYFALDLLTLPQAPRGPQTYFLYAFAGEIMAGPAATAIVDPLL